MMLYIHLPFCKSKCAYCAFCSGDYPVSLQKKYVETLCRFIAYYGKKYTFNTIYIGGGTPSVLPLDLWQILLSALDPFSANVREFTVELNPESTDGQLLSLLKQHRVNRLSFGVQTLADEELSAIGRLHTAAQAIAALRLAAASGFKNISADLIYGLPQQTSESFARTLATLLALPISHLSCYNLQLEEGTPLCRQRDSFQFPDEDAEAEMYQILLDLTKAAGMEHYEISNFALPGCKAVHNSGYWTGEDYLGLGAAAHSKLGGRRYSFFEDVSAFADKRDFSFDDFLVLTDQDKREERIMLGLRTDRGAPMSLLDQAVVERYVSFGLGSIRDDHFVLNDRGFMLSNTIISDLL